MTANQSKHLLENKFQRAFCEINFVKEILIKPEDMLTEESFEEESSCYDESDNEQDDHIYK